MQFRRPSVLPGFPLAMGVTLFYLSLIVLLPVGALLGKSASLGLDAFWAAATNARALASYKITVFAALGATAFNAAFGLLMAWILVRYEFPGRRLLDAVMDLPFALPTAVAGIALTAAFAANGVLGAPLAELGIKVAYAPLGIMIAMAFVSVPFVVRTVQPVLEDLPRETEEAAFAMGASPFQTFRRVVFPAIFPAYLSGCAMCFARCLGEFGAIIFIAGNMPFETEITALVIFIRLEEYEVGAASAIATLVLISAFLMLLLTNLVQAWHLRYTVKD